MSTHNKTPTCAQMVAQVLRDLVLKQTPLKKRGQMTPSQTKFLNSFQKEELLTRGLEWYIDRLAEFLHVSDSCFVLAIIYIDRLNDSIGFNVFNEQTYHRLLATSLYIAMKFQDDILIDDYKYIQKVVGFSFEELKSLELLFIELIDFELFVKDSVYKKYSKYLIFYQPSMKNNTNEKKVKRIMKRMTIYI